MMELAKPRPQVQVPEGFKHCYYCATTKPVGDFAIDRSRRDGLQPGCKPCLNAKKKAWEEANPEKRRATYDRQYAKNKAQIQARNVENRRRRTAELVAQFKSKPCMDCGQSYPHYVMDFDHRPGTEKKFILGGHRIQKYALEDVMDEIAKCDLICSNCHRERTHQRRCAEKGER